MEITKHDGIMLLYNSAVVLSGGYAIQTMDIGDRWALFALSFFFGIVWTVYFKYGMLHRFTDHPRFVGEEEEEEEEPTIPM